MTDRLLFDVSGLMQWYAYLANPSGVQRVMERILRSNPIASDPRVEMIARVLGSDRFFHVDTEIIVDLGDRERRPLAIARLRGLFAQSMRFAMSRRLLSDLRAYHLPYIAMGLTRLDFVWQAWCAGRAPRRMPPLRYVVPLTGSDVIIGLGDFWCHRGHVDALIGLKARSGARLMHMVHDLFPIERPEWADPLSASIFVCQFERLVPHVDQWLTNSRFVASSLVSYLAAHCEKVSPVDVVPMGWDSFDSERLSVRPEDREILAGHGLADKSYILHVGTIEPRKNLLALIDAMARLRRQLGDSAPPCVLVGRDGWKSDALRNRLRATGNEGGTVRWIKKVSDKDLPAFYRGARFTVVPSLGEGWGLPVQESLVHGVPCIASGVGGLTEAGQDLARYVDPGNPDELFAAMVHWVTDDGALAEARARIRRRFQAATPFASWDTAGKEVLRAALGAS